MLAFCSSKFIPRVYSQKISADRAFVIIVILLSENTLRALNLPSFSSFFLLWYTSLHILDYGTIPSVYSEARLG